MAKIDAVPGIEVDIISNGATLPEYLADEDEGVIPDLAKRTVTRYVELEAEKEFIFQFTAKLPYKHDCDYLGFYVSIDGEALDCGQLCGPGHLDEEDSWVETLSGVECAMTDERHRPVPGRFVFTKFKFNKISTGKLRELHLILLILILQIQFRKMEVSVHPS